MSVEILLLAAIILYTITAFVFEILPIDVVALSCLALLLLFGLVTPEEAVSGFSNPAVVTVMMMFIISDALVRSGLIRKLGYRITGVFGESRRKATFALLLLVGGLSAFINNVAAVAIFMPMAIHLAKHYRFSPSKILLPLSYASIFGGTCTLIGTSTNLLVSALSAEHGGASFEMFEFAYLGLLLFTLGMVYNVLTMRLLPARSNISSLTRKYHMSSFLTELKVAAGSKLIGQTAASAHINERYRLNVLEILRGKQTIATDIRNTALEEGDILILRGAMEDILGFKEQHGLLLLTDIKLTDEDLSDADNILAEVQLSPVSELEGLSLREINFRRRFGCFVLALNRTGGLIRKKVATIPLRRWDTLLVFGPRERVEALYNLDDFVSLQELDMRLTLSPRWWVGASIVPAVVLLAATGILSILEASILGAVALLVTRTLKVQEAYKAINWTVIFLVAAILPLGKAMENTGLARMIGEELASLGGNHGPVMVLAVIYLATSLMTEVISNNSTAVLMVPIAITVAETLGVDGKPFLMAVAFAGSASFLTPMGYKTNAMVFGPGGYRFMDYIRVGAPLKIVFWLVSTWLIPRIWTF